MLERIPYKIGYNIRFDVFAQQLLIPLNVCNYKITISVSILMSNFVPYVRTKFEILI